MYGSTTGMAGICNTSGLPWLEHTLVLMTVITCGKNLREHKNLGDHVLIKIVNDLRASLKLLCTHYLGQEESKT
jgi:hypothetical protein